MMLTLDQKEHNTEEEMTAFKKQNEDQQRKQEQVNVLIYLCCVCRNSCVVSSHLCCFTLRS